MFSFVLLAIRDSRYFIPMKCAGDLVVLAFILFHRILPFVGIFSDSKYNIVSIQTCVCNLFSAIFRVSVPFLVCRWYNFVCCLSPFSWRQIKIVVYWHVCWNPMDLANSGNEPFWSGFGSAIRASRGSNSYTVYQFKRQDNRMCIYIRSLITSSTQYPVHIHAYFIFILNTSNVQIQ